MCSLARSCVVIRFDFTVGTVSIRDSIRNSHQIIRLQLRLFEYDNLSQPPPCRIAMAHSSYWAFVAFPVPALFPFPFPFAFWGPTLWGGSSLRLPASRRGSGERKEQIDEALE